MIVFLSCVKLKRNSPCKARNMYISDLFQKSLARSTWRYEDWGTTKILQK